MKCACAARELTKEEIAALPSRFSIFYCNVNCQNMHAERWRQEQQHLGFDVCSGENVLRPGGK